MRAKCNFEVVSVTHEAVTVRDLKRGRTPFVSDARNVVAELRRSELLPSGRRLYYFDSTNELFEIVWVKDGGIAFEPGPKCET